MTIYYKIADSLFQSKNTTAHSVLFYSCYLCTTCNDKLAANCRVALCACDHAALVNGALNL